MKLQILNGKQTQNDYPYGRLRCTRYSSIEFKKNRGFRRADQTINPKTDRLNNPKRSTYFDYMTLFKEEETGYVKSKIFNVRGFSDIQLFKEFLKDNYEQLEFTAEQSEFLWKQLLGSLKISIQYTKFRGENEDEIKSTLDKFLEEIKYKETVELFKDGNSFKEFAKLDFDLAEILKKYADKNGKSIFKIG